jgi:tRNA-dihydrouridine synthase C
MWITPYVRLGGELPRRNKLLRMVAHFFETGLPVVVQLMGREVEVMAEAAYEFAQAGAVGINYNFACPSNTVIRHGAGGVHLRNPQFMVDVVEATAQKCPNLPVSIKMRMGFEQPEECKNILKALTDSACAMVAVHHRTVSENYKKVSGRIDRFLMAREAWPREMILSGDVFSVRDVTDIPPVFEGIMVARGLIRRPLLICEIREALRAGTADLNFPLHEEVSLDFMRSLAAISREDPERYWSHKYMLEMGRHIFGGESTVFRSMISLFQQGGDATALLELLHEHSSIAS